jgi:tungstate transport system ATP-binding protein
MAAVMQEPLLCRMSVGRNVALGLRFRRLPREEVERRVTTWLERLSISSLRDRPASKLSGGEAQRTSLARAMVLDPEVLFLDEPFSALDAPTRQNQLQELRALLEESGVTAVFATHDRGEALALGDRVAVLMGGHLAQVGSPEEVFLHPVGLEVARFVGIETLMPGQITGTEDGLVRVDCGGIQVVAAGEGEAGQRVHVAVRSEEVQLKEDGDPALDGVYNSIAGRVTKTVPAETHYRVEMDCGVRVVAVVSRARFREGRISLGRSMRATFPPGSVHLIRNAGD